MFMHKSFEGQRAGERVRWIFRRHISTTRSGLCFMIFMIILGSLPYIIWDQSAKMIFVWVVVGLGGVLGYGYFSFYMITNQRLRQTRQKSLFKKTVVDLDLDNIQSVSFGVPGMIGAMLDYGTILVQTGAGDLVMSMVAHPETVYNELQNAAHELRATEEE